MVKVYGGKEEKNKKRKMENMEEEQQKHEMIVKTRKERFKKNMKADVDNRLNAIVYFRPEDGAGFYSKTLEFAGWTTSHLTLSK